jgi:hypothetical protein
VVPISISVGSYEKLDSGGILANNKFLLDFNNKFLLDLVIKLLNIVIFPAIIGSIAIHPNNMMTPITSVFFSLAFFILYSPEI